MTIRPELRATAAGPATGQDLSAGLDLVAALAERGAAPALVTATERLSYAELAQRVERVALAYAGPRRLVLLTPGNDVGSVVEYLGALAADQVVLLTGAGAVDELRSAYSPDVVADRDGRRFLRDRDTSAHDLHPDLALLLSTSGSTGSPKLVRLSRHSVLANARDIATVLGIRPTDLAATTLPLHYCYGLSVLHSHLWAGAAVLLTEDSVLDEALWTDVGRHGVTTLAGVPHTFELLERSGFADRDLPSLRYLTQAGGRMPPERVRAFAELGQRRGFDLFVMYGQTEATARMAVLPPDLAVGAAGAIGSPLPGTAFSLAPVEDAEPGVGELVFHGDNVMLGYAESPADLARGRDVSELHTGDLARLRPDGQWEIVGRCSRFAKVFGLRVDLERVERVLAARGVVVAAADGGDRLVLGVCSGARPVDAEGVVALAAAELGLSPAGIRVVELAELPRLGNGKTDYRALAALGTPPSSAAPSRPAASVEVVTALYARLLGRPDARPTDSFVDLGGDSLSYVEVSLRLEQLLGHLPAGWPTMPVAALVDAPRASRARPGRLVETNVLMRALAIVSIVGTHANLFTLLGGAHVLLLVVGFNLGRFQVTAATRTERVRGLLRSTARVVVPSVAVIGSVAALSAEVTWRQALLVTQWTEWEWSEPGWSWWFIEALVPILLVVAALLAVPAVDRLERRWPFWLPVALVVASMPLRYDVIGIPGDHVHRVHGVLWLVLLGWAAAKARGWRQRAVVSLLAVAMVPGFFWSAERPVYLVLGALLLVWVPQLRVPARIVGPVGVLAAASLWIYLVHWQVYPALEDRWPLLATAASLAVGTGCWWLAGRVTGLLTDREVAGRVVRVLERVRPLPTSAARVPATDSGHRESAAR